MSTAQEIENAIRSLSAAERDKLVQHIPQLFPEFGGDLEWERIAHVDKPRPALTELLNRYEFAALLWRFACSSFRSHVSRAVLSGY